MCVVGINNVHIPDTDSVEMLPQQRENRPGRADSAWEQLVGENNGTQDAMHWRPQGGVGGCFVGALAALLQVSSAPGPRDRMEPGPNGSAWRGGPSQGDGVSGSQPPAPEGKYPCETTGGPGRPFLPTRFFKDKGGISLLRENSLSESPRGTDVTADFTRERFVEQYVQECAPTADSCGSWVPV